jgi:hypothetical protein
MLTREDVEALRALIDLVASRGDQELTPEEWALAYDLDVGAGVVLRSLGIPLPHSYHRDRLPGTGLAIHGGPTMRFLDADPGWLSSMRAVLRRAEAQLLPRPPLPEGAPLPEYVSIKDLAGRLGLTVGQVGSFLRRYAEKYPDCWIDNDHPRKGEPKKLYRTADVLPVLRERGGQK